jgi:hypothetical protein
MSLTGWENCSIRYQNGTRRADTFRSPLIGGSPFVTFLV